MLIRVLGLALLAVVVNSAMAQEIYINQHEFIPDDLPMGYSTALDAIQGIPHQKDVLVGEAVAPHVVDYHGIYKGRKESTHWLVFEKGSDLYPSVVRRRLVLTPHGYLVKTAVLCDAEKSKCERLLSGLHTMDATQRPHG
jgi:hypothetical protein